MIKSIVHSDEEAILSILKLHANGQSIDLDPTYSTGGFYKKTAVRKPRYRFDISPQCPGVVAADAANLPLVDTSIGITIFDPPFLATKGPSLNRSDKSNKLNKRFTVFPTEQLLLDFYEKSLIELYRVTKPEGILIFKCQDKVSSGKQYFSHCYVYNRACAAGWYPKDFLILLAKQRIVADWQLKNQKHARKFHSYYWVFQKKNKKWFGI